MNDFVPKVVNYIENKEWKVYSMSNFNLAKKAINEELGLLLQDICIPSFIEKNKMIWEKF